MARRVTLRPRTEEDLDAIRAYIAQDSPTNAGSFTARIRAFCEGLSEFSERGTLREDLGAGLRIIGFERSVTIAFRVLTDRVQIVRVFYRGRDFEHLIKDEPD